MRILSWHVHAAWSTAFVAGDHDHLIPVLPGRGPDGRGRPATYAWPPNAVERTPEQLHDDDIDVVVVQRESELELVREWTGRRPGRDLPVVVVEHNTPRTHVPDTHHWARDRSNVVLVHVTAFNALMWDAGSTRTVVIDHGVADPGPRAGTDVAHAAVVVNEPIRRGRTVGTDLLPRLADAVPVDAFGIAVAPLAHLHDAIDPIGDLPHDALLREVGRRAVYVHPFRWTSLGLALIEAMTMAMPVVALATTEAVDAVPREAGVLTLDPDELARATRALVDEPERAALLGKTARDHALSRFGLARFLSEWDALLEEVVS